MAAATAVPQAYRHCHVNACVRQQVLRQRLWARCCKLQVFAGVTARGVPCTRASASAAALGSDTSVHAATYECSAAHLGGGAGSALRTEIVLLRRTASQS